MNDSEKNNCVVLSRETSKRLVKDVKDLIKSPLDNEGIYYKHDEQNILKGYAYICGPKDSIYFGGNYFYEFNFPQDYPHTPPKVTFLNKGGNNGNTKFHPNMYKNGKICLSILNTWRGDTWTGCQSIRSILLTILSIMDNKPLLHEPGYTTSDKDFYPYSKIINYKNLEYSVCYILLNKATDLTLYQTIFKENIKNQFIKNKELLQEIINNSITMEPNEYILQTTIYKLVEKIDWNKINNEFNKIII